MRKKITGVVFAASLSVSPMGGAPQKKVTPVKSSSPAVKKTVGPAGRAKPRAKAAALKVPPRQLSPGVERNKEIQDALISKGYLQGPATGAWNQESSDAMRKFQEAEKLSPTGKVSARTLISLGLGPKDESLSTVIPSATPAAAPPTK